MAYSDVREYTHLTDEEVEAIGAERYHVVTPTAPDEQAHAGDENDENLALFEGHGAEPSWSYAALRLLFISRVCAASAVPGARSASALFSRFRRIARRRNPTPRPTGS